MSKRGNNNAGTGHRVNHQIRISKIRVIGPEGDQLGIMSPEEGRDIAEQHDLDLVEVAPQARPPVCRVMDYGKFKYEESKKQKSKSTRVEVKTITLRPKTDTHDLETKLRQARGFLEKGDRVRFVMRMRGREQAHTDLWFEKMDRILAQITELGNIVARPLREGRTITAMVEPMSIEKPV